ncbi:MAG: hypothetical protein GX366_08575 [Epulopiscium sp.]|nr:hypothetical protein [Candidatus Epulonipiscium sp.]
MNEKYKKYTIISLVICLTISSLLYIKKTNHLEYEFTSKDLEQADKEDKEDSKIELAPIVKTIEKVPVYVCGQVKNPDVYYLDSDAIIKEAITLAGGFTNDADVEVWNLAMQVEKGLKIYIPKQGEKIDKNQVSYDNREEGNNPPNGESGLININTATSQELTTLPGIGPVIAQNIIDYRDSNGDFQRIEDITNVSRIGQGTLDKIKDNICVH